MNESQRLKIKNAAKAEAHYFSLIQFPVQFVEVGNNGIKQDINHARRVSCYDSHSWGFIKGAEFAVKMVKEPETIESLCNRIQRELDCVCHETNSRNCPVHQNWSRESEGSGV